jgi:hypothetical protein
MAKKITETVNLDALIGREDFESFESEGQAARLGKELYLNALTPDNTLAVLRKPDFQRETSGWSPEIVAAFIKSVADGDVIPALIMWRSPKSGRTFIIDGAHRLSALVAWINDDYGDREISRDFYGDSISEQQIAIAKKTRALIKDTVGTYGDLLSYAKKPENAPSPVAKMRGTNILTNPLSVQPIEGDAQAAEESYKRINSTAVPISDDELALIDSRKLPSGIAARALMRAGTGYEYWSHLEEPYKSQIRETASLIYDQLIKPITEYPIRALDLPTSKRGYSANSLKSILDLVNIINAPRNKGKAKKQQADSTGKETLQQLEQIRRATERVFGRLNPGSLAMHPALYCYDVRGKFISKAFIGAIEFVRDLEHRDQFFDFTKHRAKFEQFLIDRPHLMTQIGKTQGSGGRRGVSAVVALYRSLFDALRRGDSDNDIIASMKANDALSFLNWDAQPEIDAGEKFELSDKNAAVITLTLSKDICPECSGRLYIADRSNDHTVRKADGGKSILSNIGLVHPYCNTGYKEKLAHEKARTRAV